MYSHPFPNFELNVDARAAGLATRPPVARRKGKLLVAFDGSPASRDALDYAVDRARVEDSDMLVVNVQEVLADSPGVFEAYRKQGERVLEHAVEQLAPHELPYSAEIAFGTPARAIVRTARYAGADHIVMGARDMSAIASVLWPRVSREVLRLADVPVIVIKEGVS